MSPKDNNTDDVNARIEQQSKVILDGELEHVSADVQAQLRLARMKAVAHAAKQSSKPSGAQPLFSKPLLALAASAVFALPLLWLVTQTQPDSSDALLADYEAQPDVTNDEPLGSGEIMLELAQLSEEDMAIVDDLEFIAWLSKQNIENEQRS